MASVEYKCPYCGSTNCFIITRVVGYFSRIDNWNEGKHAELEHRRAGDYSVETNTIGDWKDRKSNK